jgi:dihydrofolate reductase
MAPKGDVMGKVTVDMSMSLDGFIGGPNDEPQGLHDWFFPPSSSVTTGDAEVIFVLAHDVPEKVAKGEKTFTFVPNGIESALEQAKTTAGGRNVVVGGGASIAQQCIRAGLTDEIQIHLVPVLLDEGIRLFEHIGTEQIELERTRAIESLFATHLSFRVVK